MCSPSGFHPHRHVCPGHGFGEAILCRPTCRTAPPWCGRRQQRAPDSPDVSFEFALSASRLVFVSLLSLRSAVGCQMSWQPELPPLDADARGLYRRLRRPGNATRRIALLLDNIEGTGDPVLQVRDKAIGASRSLCNILAYAVSNIVECDEARASDVLSLCLHDGECCNALSSVVKELDEARAALEQFDLETVTHEQETAASRLVAKALFQADNVERRKAWRLARESSKMRATARGAAKRGERPAEMTHAQAKRYIPPGTARPRARHWARALRAHGPVALSGSNEADDSQLVAETCCEDRVVEWVCPWEGT